MFKKFITRLHRYSVKHLKSGAARVYIQNSDALQRSGFLANSKITVKNFKNHIEVHLDKNGEKKIMDTARGELLELKNKDTAKALGKANHVTITFRNGVIKINIHAEDKEQLERTFGFIQRLKKGLPIRKGCFFSGLGMLSYSIGEGLAKAGFNSEIHFANDNNEIAMACNLEGNPMWENAPDDAVAIVDDINNLRHYSIPKLDLATVSYPCVAFSTLADKENRDLKHAHCGTLFIPLVAALKEANPAVIIFENTPRFAESETLDLISRSFPGYNFVQKVLDGHDFNDLESRKRVCVIATSKGLPPFSVDAIQSLYLDDPKPKISDFLTPISDTAGCYREMAHVKARDNMPHLGYRNCLYYGHEEKMTTLPASYGSPKAGTPMIAHPTNPDLQRQVQPDEHSNLRKLPGSLKDAVLKIWLGLNNLVSVKGSATAAHRLLGNGVSFNVWSSVGYALAQYFSEIKKMELEPA